MKIRYASQPAKLEKICLQYDVELVKAGDLSAYYTCIGLAQAYNEEQHAKGFQENINVFTDKLVFLDDGSTDGTSDAFCGDNILIHLKRRRNSAFDDNANRSLLLDVAAILNTKWVIFIDFDERISLQCKDAFSRLLSHDNIEHVRFQYVHAWDGNDTYRVDYPYSENGIQYRLKMFRWKPDMQLQDTKKLHFELTPYDSDKVYKSHVLIVHLGNVSVEDRVRRYNTYTKLDPENTYQDSYEHLISKNIVLEQISSLYAEEARKKFSVIVLTHKIPTLLANCLKHIRNTTGNRVLEVIVVNDGGPKEIKAIADSFSHSLQIQYIRFNHNKGISHARNAGIQAALGENITIFADNYTPRPDHFEQVQKHLKSFATVASNIHTVGRGIGPTVLHRYYQFVIASWTKNALKTSEGYTGKNFPAGAASSFRIECMEEVGLFDVSLKSSEDTDYNRRVDERNMQRLYAENVVVFRTELDGFFATLQKQYAYGTTIFQFREKNTEQHFIRYEIKHALYILRQYLKTTRDIWCFPFVAMLHSALRMGIIAEIIKKRIKRKRT